jgi:hypothetical protein
MRADIKPVGTIEDMFMADMESLEWEVLRWGRLKWTLLQATGLKTLQNFLVHQLESNYALHEEHFKDYLAKILQNSLPEEQADSAEMLAAECAPNTDEAGSKLDEVLRSIGLNTGTVLDDARAQRAKELVQGYVRREPDAVTLVQELLMDNNVSMDSFMADALAENLEYIERIDRLMTIAEERRNAMLAEIERRRAVFGATLTLTKFLTSTPQGPQKFATILSEDAKRLLAMDRYERRALLRRKIAIQLFDEAKHYDCNGL